MNELVRFRKSGDIPSTRKWYWFSTKDQTVQKSFCLLICWCSCSIFNIHNILCIPFDIALEYHCRIFKIWITKPRTITSKEFPQSLNSPLIWPARETSVFFALFDKLLYNSVNRRHNSHHICWHKSSEIPLDISLETILLLIIYGKLIHKNFPF